MSFWSKFEALCFEHNLKPQSSEIMEVIGVTSPAITAWKKGSKPKFDTISKIANYFNVDVRYLLDLSDSPHGEDIIENMMDKLLDGGVEIDSFDDGNGVGQEYVLTYQGKSHNYQEHDFKKLCNRLQTALNDAELQTIDKFCRETFANEVFPDPYKFPSYTEEEQELIEKYRKLSQDSKIIVNATIIQEIRRQE